MENEDGPLALATLEEIQTELARRFEGYVLIVTKQRNASDDRVRIVHYGGYLLSIGMCEYAKDWIMRKGREE